VHAAPPPLVYLLSLTSLPSPPTYRSRLSRLLSKERALRRNTTDVLEEPTVEDIKEKVKQNGIDTSPLTSPENMAHTR
jgi:hypothetical protein